MRLIDADALDEALTALRFTTDGELAHWGDRKDWCLHGSEIEMLIANAPTIDAEPVKAIEQFKWERDVAIEQLNEIGKGLGSRMDDVATVVRCKDCKWWDKKWGCETFGFTRTNMENFYCADGERRTDETD